MKKPIIGVIGRAEITQEDDKTICIYEKVRRAILKCGGQPIGILPPQNIVYADIRPRDAAVLTEDEKTDLIDILSICDGIFLQGGSFWYHYDEFICEYALLKDIPLLGVCMGMQILGKIDNKKKEGQAIRNIRNDTVIEHKQKDKDYVHSVKIKKDTLLYSIVGKEEIEVNSIHNYHIPFVTTLHVSAESSDGIIEAIEDDQKRFVLGVQWHPEDMVFYDENAEKIMTKFIEKSKQYQLEKLKENIRQ